MLTLCIKLPFFKKRQPSLVENVMICLVFPLGLAGQLTMAMLTVDTE